MKKFIPVLLLVIFAFPVGAADQKLCDEIANDPLGRGYASMTTEEISADLSTEYRQVFYSTVSGMDLFEGIEPADWVTLSEANKTQVLSLLSFPVIKPQGKVRTFLISIFGGGSATIANMANISRHYLTRSTELGVSDVRPGVIQECL